MTLLCLSRYLYFATALKINDRPSTLWIHSIPESIADVLLWIAKTCSTTKGSIVGLLDGHDGL